MPDQPQHGATQTVRVTLAAAASAGDALVWDDRLVVAATDGAIGDEIVCWRDGTHLLPKTNAQTYTSGEVLFWNTGTDSITNAAQATQAGRAARDVGVGDFGHVALDAEH